MARIRTIKPEFWTDEKVVQLPYAARLLFIGMWNFADDDGYLMDEPDRLRMQILPADSEDIGVLLDRLVIAGLVDRVVLEDCSTALRIPSFGEHQKISHKSDSKILPLVRGKVNIPASVRRDVATKYNCPPGGTVDAECYYCGAPGRIHWQQVGDGRPGSWVSFSRLTMDHFVPESGGGATSGDNIVLACSHCNKSKGIRPAFSVLFDKTPEDSREVPETSGCLSPEGKGREGKGRDNTPHKPPKGGDDAFEVWWGVVHTKTGKEDARRAYRKAVGRLKEAHADPHAFLIDRMKAFAATPSAKPTDRSPIHPATWLNKGRYDDDPASWGRAGPPEKQPQRLPPLAEAIATWNPYQTPQ